MWSAVGPWLVAGVIGFALGAWIRGKKIAARAYARGQAAALASSHSTSVAQGGKVQINVRAADGVLDLAGSDDDDYVAATLARAWATDRLPDRDAQPGLPDGGAGWPGSRPTADLRPSLPLRARPEEREL